MEAYVAAAAGGPTSPKSGDTAQDELTELEKARLQENIAEIQKKLDRRIGNMVKAHNWSTARSQSPS